MTIEEAKANGWLYIEDLKDFQYLLKEIEGNLEDGFTWKAYVEHGSYLFEVDLYNQASNKDLDFISKQVCDFFRERGEESEAQLKIDQLEAA